MQEVDPSKSKMTPTMIISHFYWLHLWIMKSALPVYSNACTTLGYSLLSWACSIRCFWNHLMFHTAFTLCFTPSPPLSHKHDKWFIFVTYFPPVLTLQTPLPGIFLSLVLYLEVVSGALINVHSRAISPGNVKNIFSPCWLVLSTEPNYFTTLLLFSRDLFALLTLWTPSNPWNSKCSSKEEHQRKLVCETIKHSLGDT